MARFSIKDLLVATVLVAVGLTIALFATSVVVEARMGQTLVHVLVGIYFVGCVVVGVGLVYPFAKPHRTPGFVVSPLVGLIGGLIAIFLHRL